MSTLVDDVELDPDLPERLERSADDLREAGINDLAERFERVARRAREVQDDE